MNLHNKCIEETKALLANLEFRKIDIEEPLWKDVGNDNFILKGDSAYELGYEQGLMLNLITSDDIGEDEIFLCGKDLYELKEAKSYLRIAVVEIADEDEEANTLYEHIKQIGYTRYRVSPAGFMLKVSGIGDLEKVRISKEAINNKISFREIGNMYLKAYKILPYVKKVKLYFITEDVAMDPFFKISKETNDITKAIDHVLKNIALDCDSCNVKPICDSVQGMRELHQKELNG